MNKSMNQSNDNANIHPPKQLMNPPINRYLLRMTQQTLQSLPTFHFNQLSPKKQYRNSPKIESISFIVHQSMHLYTKEVKCLI